MSNYEIRIEVSELKKALAVLGTRVPGKSSLPILGDILITYDRSRKVFSLTACDSDAWLTIEAVKSPDENGERKPWLWLDGDDRTNPFKAVCIGYAEMKEAFSALPSMPVHAFINPEKNTMKVDYMKGHFTMAVNISGQPEDYPPVPRVITKDVPAEDRNQGINPICSFTLPTAGLLPIVKAARCAVANDELRPVMNAECFDCYHDHLVIVSTDGHSLFRQQIDTGIGWLRYGEFPATDSAKLLVPSSVLSTILNAFAATEAITVTADSQRLLFEADGISLTSRSVEGNYPKYDKGIPKNNNHLLVVDRTEMMVALRRVRVFANENSELVEMRRDEDQLTLSSRDVDYNRAAAEHVSIINADTTLPDRFTIGGKISKLMGLLECIGTDSVRLYFSEPSKAFLLRNDDDKSSLTLLMMPMLVDKK